MCVSVKSFPLCARARESVQFLTRKNMICPSIRRFIHLPVFNYDLLFNSVFIRLSVCLSQVRVYRSVYMSVYRCICSYKCLLIDKQTICLCVYQSVCHVCLSVCEYNMSVSLSVYLCILYSYKCMLIDKQTLSVCMCVYMYVCLSICAYIYLWLSVCLSVCLRARVCVCVRTELIFCFCFVRLWL